DFFNENGFASFSLEALGVRNGPNSYIPAISIAPDIAIAPKVKSWTATVEEQSVILAPDTLPEAFRPPVTLSLDAVGVRDEFSGELLVRGDLVFGRDAMISAGPMGTVSLGGDTIAVLGSIRAPGGNISISGARSSIRLFDSNARALTTVEIAAGSMLSVAGEVLPIPNSLGFQTGTVLRGGTIGIAGNIVADAGATLDVSGASGDVDVASPFTDAVNSADPAGSPFIRTHIESDAGSIIFNGGEELFTDATLIGRAGGSSASGGKLVVGSGRFNTPGSSNQATPLDITLMVTQDGPTIPAEFHSPDLSAIGRAPGDSLGLGHFAASSLNGSGLDSLVLRGTVQFLGDVTLNLNRRLSVADAGVLFADRAVSLSAPYVALGKAFAAPVAPQQIP